MSFKNKIIGSIVLNQEQSIEWNEIISSGEIDNSLVIDEMFIDLGINKWNDLLKITFSRINTERNY